MNNKRKVKNVLALYQITSSDSSIANTFAKANKTLKTYKSDMGMPVF